MADEDRPGLLRYGDDYTCARWTADDLDKRGKIIWHDGLPSQRDWDRVTMVTLNYDPKGEGNYRNVPINPDRPLDPLGSDRPGYIGPHKGGRYGPEFYYDLDDLATEFQWSAFSP